MIDNPFLKEALGESERSRRCLFSWSCFRGVTTSFPPDVMAAWSTPSYVHLGDIGIHIFISLHLPMGVEISNWNHLQAAQKRRKVVDVIFEPGALYEEGSGISAVLP